MAVRTLLVSAPGDLAHRRAIEAALPPGIGANHLDDVDPDGRPAAVAAADAVLSWVPHDETGDVGIAALHRGQFLQTFSAGVDHLPLERLPEGLTVLSNAGAYAEPMAEHVLAMYLALSKRLLPEHTKLQAGEFDQYRSTRWVAGSTCAIVGYGAIGEATAELFQRMDVSVLAINRSGEADVEPAYLGTPDDLEAVLRQCDGAVLSAPLTPDTEGLIGRGELSWMADDAMLVNVGRGALIDQAALYDHLRAHPEFRAGLEAWWTEPVPDGRFALEYPLLDLPNVLGCPHNSAQVPDVRERGLRHAVANVATALVGEPENVVDRELGY